MDPYGAYVDGETFIRKAAVGDDKTTTVDEAVVMYGPISKKELQERTEISWGMVSDLVNQLVEEKYIVPSVRESNGVGRKAEEFDVNHEEHYCIGIDLSSNGLPDINILNTFCKSIHWMRFSLIP